MSAMLFGSVARIADLADGDFDVAPIDREHWAAGDYVVGLVIGETTELYRVETLDGSIVPAAVGDRAVGALGDRAATLEGVGSYRDIGSDGRMNFLTSAGLVGRTTSLSPLLPATMSLVYEGHVLRGGNKLRMRDFAIRSEREGFATPTVLLVGTSMSAGKTETGKLISRLLSEDGRRVIGAKLTGAGRYRDILAFRNAGASEIFDFVDAGMPSTIVPENEFRAAIRPLLSHIDGLGADLLVAEAGASPLEPYNGAAVIEELGDNVCMTVLCASDPYAVVGVMQAFGLRPDLVTGPATNTSAAIELLRSLADVRGINILDPNAEPDFRRFLADGLERAGVGKWLRAK